MFSPFSFISIFLITVSSFFSPLPSLRIPFTSHPPVIDGQAGDKVWEKASPVISFIDIHRNLPARSSTSVKMLWDTHALYILAKCQDPQLFSPQKNHDDDLWHYDCMEFFLDPVNNGKKYIELEVSPRGILYDAQVTFSKAIDFKATKKFDWPEIVVKTTWEGTLDEKNDIDEGWTMEMELPWSVFSGFQSSGIHFPPESGDEWKGNITRGEFGKEEANGGIGSKQEAGHLYSWARVKKWFHEPWRWGRFVFIRK